MQLVFVKDECIIDFKVAKAETATNNNLNNLCGGGGVLNESPLQWAIRKRYYAMAELLTIKAKADLSHKSAQGSDALQLACKLGVSFLISNNLKLI